MFQHSKESYLYELYDIRTKLQNFVQKISNGESTYYKDISVKLRILYCYKSGTKPLLKLVEELFEFEILVAITYSTKEQVSRGLLPPSLAEGLIFEQINSVATWFELGHELMAVFDAIERDEVLLSGELYSYKSIIEVAADKMGAHVDPKIPIRDIALHSGNFLVGGLPVAQRALYDTAKASILLINIIEDYVVIGKGYPFIRKKTKP